MINKASKTILITSIIVFGAGVLLTPSTFAQAQNLVVEFETTPLFDEANFLPGDNVPRWVRVTNNSGQIQPIATEAINYPGFPGPDAVPADDLSRALLIVIREKGGSDLYGGSAGEKTLFNFYEDGETYLSDISADSSKEYEFEVIFPAEKENEWEGKTTNFDILIGFQGIEGSMLGGRAGGGVSPSPLPSGLTILDETLVLDVGETSITITWTTTYSSTSRVIYSRYDESHTLDLSDIPNYGYAHSTAEDPAKVLFHTVTITGLELGTTYYFRCISHASPEDSISREYSFTTKGVAGTVTREEIVPSAPPWPPAPSIEEEKPEAIAEKPLEIAEKPPISEEVGLPKEITPPEERMLQRSLASILAAMGMAGKEISQSTLLTALVILCLAGLVLIGIREWRLFQKKRKK